MFIHKRAGKSAKSIDLININKLIQQYYLLKPKLKNNNYIKFGTSGYRGSASHNSFNEQHVIAITQAIIDIRRNLKYISNTCLVGKDTHALSNPAFMTVIEVLIANGINVITQQKNTFTPTPSISHAILKHNKYYNDKIDGIAVTPSHNPPEYGGIKYITPYGGPADAITTLAIESRANYLLNNNLLNIKQIPYNMAIKQRNFYQHDFIEPYITSLHEVINMSAIQQAKLKIGIEPLGGAGIDYWKRIAEYYKLNLTLINEKIDPTFSFIPLDYDGKLRMDCSSSWVMKNALKLKNKFDLILTNDPDYDRYGIITPCGLMNPNHYLAVAIDYLFNHRSLWKKNISVGKTIVTSSIIDRIVDNIGIKLIEMPVGFKWFVNDLYQGKYGIAGEESAGASFLRFDGTPWTTDKDGIILCLLAAEITAVTGQNPQQYYNHLIHKFGESFYSRMQLNINYQQKKYFNVLTNKSYFNNKLAGDQIVQYITHAPGNDVCIDGIKIVTDYGWCVIRSSGTEDVYKIYCESFRSKHHLKLMETEIIKLLQQTIIS
uniref:Phosphoglucomutase (Alpha-D-glucose-1,6-bisphosphate-dependent) n=1 Tax=Candidatus Aschnera chinzeii TaxID=1485666 RepID=A0AAT9G504_9ENTR|nr:MAG: phosphoglucomutase (alpha-D-glucose-1,6-bisphosphate-dependent) [Candidatus Aschnera chinzeii]